MPTRANGQPAFGCYFQPPQTEIARPAGLLVLTLDRDQISAITWFGDNSIFPLVRLVWAKRDGRDEVVVRVTDFRDDDYFEIRAEPTQALDVYYHPFAYRDVSTVGDGSRSAVAP